MQMIPQSQVTLADTDMETFEKIVDVLEDLEDVQNVYHNVEFAE